MHQIDKILRDKRLIGFIVVCAVLLLVFVFARAVKDYITYAQLNPCAPDTIQAAESYTQYTDLRQYGISGAAKIQCANNISLLQVFSFTMQNKQKACLISNDGNKFALVAEAPYATYTSADGKMVFQKEGAAYVLKQDGVAIYRQCAYLPPK